MAIRNTNYGGATNWTSEVLTSADLNDTFTASYDCSNSNDAVQNNSILENAINIARLEYCASIADIDHDYMVVDVFSDSTGYNNTIDYSATSSTNMYYSGADLTGYFENRCTVPAFCGCVQQLCQGGSGAPSAAEQCYGVSLSYTIGSGVTGFAEYSGCPRAAINIDADTKEFCYNGVCIISGDATAGGSFSLVCLDVANSLDNTAISTTVIGGASYSSTVTNSYCYVCTGANAFDFYCNTVCTTNISSVTSFPHITGIVHTCVCGGAGGCANACSRYCFTDLCVQYATGCVVSVPVCYTTSSQSVYMVAQNDSTTLIYDVYDANNTSTAIATSLAVNTQNCLSTCVDCHIYHFRPQNFDNGCFKTSYAIAVTVG